MSQTTPNEGAHNELFQAGERMRRKVLVRVILNAYQQSMVPMVPNSFRVMLGSTATLNQYVFNQSRERNAYLFLGYYRFYEIHATCQDCFPEYTDVLNK